VGWHHVNRPGILDVCGCAWKARRVEGSALAAMSRSVRRGVLVALKLVLTVALTWYALRSVPFGEVAAAFRRAEPTVIAIYMLCYLALVAFHALRWQLFIALSGYSAGFAELFRVYLSSTFFQFYLPASIGGDVYRGYVLHEKTKSVANATVNIGAERGFALYLMFVVAGFTALVFPIDVPRGLLVLLLVPVVAGPVLALVAARFPAEWVWPAPARKAFVALRDEALAMVGRARAQPRLFGKVVAATILYQVGANTAVVLIFRALGHNVDIVMTYCVMTIISTAVFIPVSINGFGIRENLFLASAPVLHVDQASALAASLLVAAGHLAMGLLGGVVYLATRDRAGDTPPAGVAERPAGRAP
jgi:hypothetical protein